MEVNEPNFDKIYNFEDRSPRKKELDQKEHLDKEDK